MFIEMRIPVRRQFPPAITGIDADQFQAPQQGSGIDQIKKDAGFTGAHLLVIEIENLVEAIVLDEIECEMPPLMHGETDGLRPMRFEIGQPADPLDGAGLHFQHMSNCMDGPGIGRIGLDGAPTGDLRLLEVAGLFEAEGIHPQDEAVMRMVRRPGRQHPGDRIAEIGAVTEIEIGVMGKTQGPKIIRMLDEDAFPDASCPAAILLGPGAQSRDMRPFAGR